MNSHIDLINERFPNLSPVLEKLNSNNIAWVIGGSACLYILGNDRFPDDVDIYLTNTDHDIANKLFEIEPFIYNSDIEVVRNSNPDGTHSIQFTSNLKLKIEGRIYDLSLSQEILGRRLHIGNFYLLPPEEVILFKTLLQRGLDVGKHDIEDIQKFKRIYDLNTHYIQQRIHELQAGERIGNILD